MLSTLTLYFSRNKALLIAIIISLLIHSSLVSKFAFTLPDLDESQQTIAMRLVSLPPTPKPTPATIKKASPKPEPQVAQTNSEITQATNDDPISPVAEGSVIQDTTATAPVLGITAPTTTEQAGAEPTPTDATEAGDIASDPKPPVYQYVKTEFDVYRGGDAAAAGTASITFSMDKNGTYALNSITQAKGLAALFFGTLVQKSEGVVTEKGLVPNYFFYQYGNNKAQTANFAWSDGVLQIRSAKGDKTESLVAGTQDLLSFMYQFMFMPPLETTQITMTNGKGLRTYAYSFEGEEVINTKLGEFKTVHLLTSGNEEDKAELWLALDYQYLPVKIRKIEKNGSVIEQIITKIQTTPPH